MATRRRSTRTSRPRTSSTARYGTTRRRRARTSTTLGGAAALGLIALVTRLSWFWRIGIVVVVLLLAALYFVWSRRHDIAEEMQAAQGTRPAPSNDAPAS